MIQREHGHVDPGTQHRLPAIEARIDISFRPSARPRHRISPYVSVGRFPDSLRRAVDYGQSSTSVSPR
jgi:hypothetical protein